MFFFKILSFNSVEIKVNTFLEFVFKNRPSPRWIVFVLDSFIGATAFILASLLRFNFRIPEEYFLRTWEFLPFLLLLNAAFFRLFRTYSGTIRHSGFMDLFKVLGFGTASTSVLIIFNITTYFFSNSFIIPLSIVIINFALTSLGMIFLRLFAKYSYNELINWKKGVSRTAIIASRDQAVLIRRALEMDNKRKHQLIAIFDFHKVNHGIDLNGIRTYHIDSFLPLVEKLEIDEIVIPKGVLQNGLKKMVVDYCLENKIKIFVLPNIQISLHDQKKKHELRQISMEDLLEREPIRLNMENISAFVAGKRILVTGAAGSIGSEIVRQLITFKPEKLILLDQAETPVFELENEIRNQLSASAYKIIIGDVTNKEKMKHLFETYSPEIVYHAAAYKHVPLMEQNPYEAFRTNVMGTKILADCASKNGVSKFIMISTDKAVNPTNVMGASKRMAEMYIQALNNISYTGFITTRFGNVIGSNGSVIPLFQKQINAGGPVTVTHPDITRYFMTIPEACQLVLEAGTMGKGGEVFLFDMGKSVRIADLAQNMIKLAGLIPEIDIKIKYTGLRPGEKLYEELLYDKENAIPTHHPKITIARVENIDYLDVSSHINAIIAFTLKSNSNDEIVRMMKEMVPEYISNNSDFCALDNSKALIERV